MHAYDLALKCVVIVVFCLLMWPQCVCLASASLAIMLALMGFSVLLSQALRCSNTDDDGLDRCLSTCSCKLGTEFPMKMI